MSTKVEEYLAIERNSLASMQALVPLVYSREQFDDYAAAKKTEWQVVCNQIIESERLNKLNKLFGGDNICLGFNIQHSTHCEPHLVEPNTASINNFQQVVYHTPSSSAKTTTTAAANGNKTLQTSGLRASELSLPQISGSNNQVSDKVSPTKQLSRSNGMLGYQYNTSSRKARSAPTPTTSILKCPYLNCEKVCGNRGSFRQHCSMHENKGDRLRDVAYTLTNIFTSSSSAETTGGDEATIQRECRRAMSDMLDKIVSTLEITEIENDVVVKNPVSVAKRKGGSNVRQSYSISFKKSVIDRYDMLKTEATTTQYYSGTGHQDELADYFGVDKSCISRWLTNRHKIESEYHSTKVGGKLGLMSKRLRTGSNKNQSLTGYYDSSEEMPLTVIAVDTRPSQRPKNQRCDRGNGGKEKGSKYASALADSDSSDDEDEEAAYSR